MKIALLVLQTACLLVSVQAWGLVKLSEQKKEEMRKKIDELKKCRDELFDQIDELNANVCGNGAGSLELCNIGASMKDYTRCISNPACGRPVITGKRLGFVKRLPNQPIIALGTSGLTYVLGADYELDVPFIGKSAFLLTATSDNLFAPSLVKAQYFSCPRALNF